MIRKLKFFAVLILLLWGCQTHDNPNIRVYEKERLQMGTLFKIKVAVNENQYTTGRLDSAIEKAFNEIDRLEQDMSEWIKTSPISMAAYHAGQKPVLITPEISELVAKALSISKQTDGAFDISFKPLGKLWDVKNRTEPPSQDAIDSAKALVNYNRIELEETELKLFLKKQGMSIGLGGIAKGYAAEAAGKILALNGITNYIVYAGGDLYVSGQKGSLPWTSGIKNPKAEERLFSTFGILKSQGIATSGDYENYFVYQGRKYHHIINPKTGYPSEGYRSVTVFSENPALADAYATAFFILGYEKALAIVDEVKTIAFIMIDNSYELKKSPNLDQFIEEF